MHIDVINENVNKITDALNSINDSIKNKGINNVVNHIVGLQKRSADDEEFGYHVKAMLIEMGAIESSKPIDNEHKPDKIKYLVNGNVEYMMDVSELDDFDPPKTGDAVQLRGEYYVVSRVISEGDYYVVDVMEVN